MVRDVAKLKSTRSGAMQDGWSTQGYLYQQCKLPEEDLVLGAETRRKQRDSLLLRLKHVGKQRQCSNTSHGNILIPPRLNVLSRLRIPKMWPAGLAIEIRCAVNQKDRLGLSTRVVTSIRIAGDSRRCASTPLRTRV